MNGTLDGLDGRMGHTAKARSEGHHDRLQGKPLTACPYPQPGFLCKVWQNGWIDEDRSLGGQHGCA